MPRYSWTQPICDACWNARNPGRPAVRLVEALVTDAEICCHCGKFTRSRIYVRVDPATVSHPTNLGS